MCPYATLRAVKYKYRGNYKMMKHKTTSLNSQERSFGLVALLDAQTETTIRGLWCDLKIESITDSLPRIACAQPHITLAVFPAANKQLVDGMAALAAEQPPFALKYSSVGAFPRMALASIFLQPVVTPHLLTLQRAVRALLSSSGLDINDFYQEENWQPHSSLGLGLSPAMAAKAFSFSLGLDLPIVGQVQAIGLIEMIRQETFVISGCQLASWKLGSGEHLPGHDCPNPLKCLFKTP